MKTIDPDHPVADISKHHSTAAGRVSSAAESPRQRAFEADSGSWVITERKQRNGPLRSWVVPCSLCGEHYHVSIYDVHLLPNPWVTVYCEHHRVESARRDYLRANLGLSFYEQKQSPTPDTRLWMRRRR